MVALLAHRLENQAWAGGAKWTSHRKSSNATTTTAPPAPEANATRLRWPHRRNAATAATETRAPTPLRWPDGRAVHLELLVHDDGRVELACGFAVGNRAPWEAVDAVRRTGVVSNVEVAGDDKGRVRRVVLAVGLRESLPVA